MTTTASTALDKLFDPVGRCLTPEVARALAGLRADPDVQARIDEFADKNTAGQLTPEERAEYDMLLSALSVVTVLQSKARTLLKARGRNGDIHS